MKNINWKVMVQCVIFGMIYDFVIVKSKQTSQKNNSIYKYSVYAIS